MKIITAIDSMKGSMTSIEANNIIEQVFSDDKTEVKKIAIADGGEGTVAAFLENCNGEKKSGIVHDMCGNKFEATYAWIEHEKLAVIESADTAGIHFLRDVAETHPRETSTFGVGETILLALKNGAKKIIIGLGGTGTVDGGIGAMAALGVVFLGATGEVLKPIGGNVGRIDKISYSNINPLVKKVEFILATDIDSYLTGEFGAVKMFGRQKGISEAEKEQYETDMLHYQQKMVFDRNFQRGDGAAGGLGLGLRILLNAQVKSGLKLLSEYSGINNELETADLVITGEGKMDNQSLQGKVPVGISELAKIHKLPVIAFVGLFEGDLELFKKAGIDVVVPIVSSITSLEEAMLNAHSNLKKASVMVKNLLAVQNNISE
ncbi:MULTISPECIES: glycerate kinase family protein [unclassified Enterococcus]|uniref:glycerate kinase family protein n=1 Tax=unclassified Enterococcus TaxID=2608891 RepID=UPI003F1E8AC2